MPGFVLSLWGAKNRMREKLLLPGSYILTQGDRQTNDVGSDEGNDENHNVARGEREGQRGRGCQPDWVVGKGLPEKGAFEQRPQCAKGLARWRLGEEPPGRASSKCRGHESSTHGRARRAE